MAINLKQYTGSTVTPTDDALLYDFIMSEQSGIFEGCEVTHLGANQLQISDGRGLIRGRVFTVGQQTILANVSPSGSVKGRLIVKVDLGNGEAPISLVTQAASVLPALTQQDINRDGTVFELPLATYDVTEVLISGLVSVANKLTAPIDDKLKQSVANLEKGKYNAAAKKSGTTVAITGPAGAETVVFVAPSDWTAGDTYTINGQAVTLTDLNGEPLDDAWKQGSPVQLFVQGTKAFFKAGGGKVPADLPPLLPNFALEFSGTTVTVTANKLPLNDKTSMLAGGVWVLASTVPDSPKGAIVKEWSQSDLIDSTQDTESSEVVTWTYPNWSAGEPIYCRQYTYNEKGQYNTALYGGLVSTEDVTFKLPEFTGNHAIFGDETAGRIELYESGELTLSPGTYDFFLVGGGSGSSYDFNDYNNSSSSTGTSGGGAGYTLTIKDHVVTSSYPISVIVGGPSVSSAKLPEGSELPRTTFAGNPTSIGLADKTYVAEGGKVTRNGQGTNRMANLGYDGGSGGSSKNAGAGGSDGGNGSGSTGGLGQGTTTRAFGDPDGTLYAGGGGGFQTLGGPGGGGNGATTTTESAGTPGTPNTGGGAGGSYRRFGGMAAVAAGGSGIVIVRWNNA